MKTKYFTTYTILLAVTAIGSIYMANHVGAPLGFIFIPLWFLMGWDFSKALRAYETRRLDE